MENIPHTGKSPSALRTIGEAAGQLDVPQHVLRFWESKFDQITPEKHRGRRYYRQEDILILEQIKTLLYKEGYTIKGVQNFLSQKNRKYDNLQPDLFLEGTEEIESAVMKEPTTKKSPSGLDKQTLEEVLRLLRQSRDMLQQSIKKE